MAVLGLSGDAQSDLAKIRAADPAHAALLEVALQEVEGDPSLANNLLDHKFGENYDGPYSVSRWTRLWKRGLDIWRLRLMATEAAGLPYRIVYAYLRTQRTFCVLAIVHKSEIDYDDPNHPLTQRILATYNKL